MEAVADEPRLVRRGQLAQLGSDVGQLAAPGQGREDIKPLRGQDFLRADEALAVEGVDGVVGQARGEDLGRWGAEPRMVVHVREERVAGR
eukprot:3348890-Alexandrium_andersonii.AAC.1